VAFEAGAVTLATMKRRDPRATTLNLDRLRNDPELCLDSIDPVASGATFLELPLLALGPPAVRVEQASSRFSVDLSELCEQTDLAAPPARVGHYVFMTEYCGSTLLSQALGSFHQVFAYGERYPLASVAAYKRGLLGVAPDPMKTDFFVKLVLHYQAKTARPEQCALLKEWSVSNILIDDVLRGDSRSRVIFMYSGLEHFLASVLKSKPRRALARQRVAKVFTDLNDLVALRQVNPLACSDCEIAAVHWLYQMYWFLAHGAWATPRVRTLSFERLERDPVGVLRACTQHLGIDVPERDLRGVVDGPTFRTHAKSGVPFTAEDHIDALATARARYRAEIDAGLSFAERYTAEHPIPAVLPTPLPC
jgi:hypothetical protein